MSDFRKVGDNFSNNAEIPKVEYYDSGDVCSACSAPILAWISKRPAFLGGDVELKKGCECVEKSEAEKVQRRAEMLLRSERELTHAGFLNRFDKAHIMIPQNRTYGKEKIVNPVGKVAAIEFTTRFFDAARKGGNVVGLPGFALYGKNGVGKSHLAYLLAERLNDLNITTCVTTLMRVSNAFRFSFQANEESTSARITADLATVPVLIIDDFGKEQVYNSGSGEFIQSAIFEIIDQRVLRGLPIIVTSNRSFENLRDVRYKGSEWGKGLLDRVLESMGGDASRWCEIASPWNHRTKQNEYAD